MRSDRLLVAAWAQHDPQSARNERARGQYGSDGSQRAFGRAGSHCGMCWLRLSVARLRPPMARMS